MGLWLLIILISNFFHFSPWMMYSILVIHTYFWGEVSDVDWRRAWQPTPVFLPGKSHPMDRGTWWASVHGVARSLTWLKWLSMHTQTRCRTLYFHKTLNLFLFCLLLLINISVCHTASQMPDTSGSNPELCCFDLSFFLPPDEFWCPATSWIQLKNTPCLSSTSFFDLPHRLAVSLHLARLPLSFACSRPVAPSSC